MNNDPERAELEAMTARIRQAEGKPADTREEANSQPVKMSRIGFDFMGSVLGGTVLGWLLDKYLPEVAPWGLIAMILLGFGAGIMNVWRALSAPNKER
jgi:ATP synthase protein I